MLTEADLCERLRAGLKRELAAINPDLRERLRTELTRTDPAERDRSPRRRPAAADLLLAAGTLAALCLGALVVVLLVHPRSSLSPGARDTNRVGLRLLDGDSLNSVRFGEPPSAVYRLLKPLLGDPVGQSRARPTGLGKSLCAFSGQIEWNRQIASAEGRSIYDDLVAYFKGSRFVGYSYAEVWTPYGRRPVLPADHLLTTARGLTLNQPVPRARRIYGEAFVQTTQPQGTPPSKKLMRLPAWRVRTPSGELFGWLTSSRGADIGSIEAGAVPNTPCHRPHPGTR
jgi:hypothetical protein